MRILYGLAGVGMGHATRSKVAIAHLERRGHEVLAAASSEAYRLLSAERPARTLRIEGLSIRCTGGEFDLRETIADNIARLPHFLTNENAWRRCEDFRPDVAVTDFEWFPWVFAKSHGLPIISIDNHQIVPRCLHDPRIVAMAEVGFRQLAAFTEYMAPDCDAYVVTSFYHPPIRPELAGTTTLVPPVLRQAVIDTLDAARSPTEPHHVLVYKTSVLDDESFLDVLAQAPRVPFVVYGASEHAAHPPNVAFRKLDEAGFIRDLAACRAVVGNGGMSLLGEAIALRKPMLSIPVRGQFEQVMNAAYLARLGYGAHAEQLDVGTLASFLRQLPAYEAALHRAAPHDRNARFYAALDALFPQETGHA